MYYKLMLHNNVLSVNMQSCYREFAVSKTFYFSKVCFYLHKNKSATEIKVKPEKKTENPKKTNK